MKAAGLLNQILAIALLFTTVSASWRWPLFSNHAAALDRRQQNNDETITPTSPTPTRTTNTASSASSNTRSASSNTDSDASSETDSSSEASNTSSGTASGSNTRTASGSNTRTTSRSTKSSLVDPRLPAGGVQLMTPAATAGSQYYKVGDYITFEWNYTSLVNTPAAIDVFATCTLNSATYTIASNMTVGETGRAVWDTGDKNAAEYVVATYTLFIHDAARDPTQVPSAGDLGVFNQFRFGMYTGQPYTPLNEFKCSTCSNGAGLSLGERQALSVLGVTVAVTMLSATWFANGAGLFA